MSSVKLQSSIWSRRAPWADCLEKGILVFDGFYCTNAHFKAHGVFGVGASTALKSFSDEIYCTPGSEPSKTKSLGAIRATSSISQDLGGRTNASQITKIEGQSFNDNDIKINDFVRSFRGAFVLWVRDVVYT